MRKKSTAKRPVKATNNKTANGFIRIISGQFRGRKLPVKDVQGLRPTTDRIKETVFNWLMQDTRDAAYSIALPALEGLVLRHFLVLQPARYF